MTTLESWRNRLAEELTGKVIPFWEKFSIDRECGGYLTCLERNGQPYDGQKQMWMQWREVYMFAALYNSCFRKDEFFELANHGFEFLRRHGRKEDGAYAYMLDRRGNIIADKADGAEVFTSSFAAVAAAELYQASGEQKYADEAFHALKMYRAAVAAAENNSRTVHLAHPMIRLNVLSIMHRIFGDVVSRQEINACRGNFKSF